MSQIRDLAALTPEALVKCAEWLRLCNRRGISVLIYETFRSAARQADLFAVGRDEEGVRVPNTKILTHCRPGGSYHQYGVAWDAVPRAAFVVRGEPRSKLDWDPFTVHGYRGLRDYMKTGSTKLMDSTWRVLIETAAELGIRNDGRTSLHDFCHWQFCDRSIEELKSGNGSLQV